MYCFFSPYLCQWTCVCSEYAFELFGFTELQNSLFHIRYDFDIGRCVQRFICAHHETVQYAAFAFGQMVSPAARENKLFKKRRLVEMCGSFAVPYWTFEILEKFESDR